MPTWVAEDVEGATFAGLNGWATWEESVEAVNAEPNRS